MSSSYDWHWLIKAQPQGSSKLKLGTLRHVGQLGHPIHVQLDQLLLAAEVGGCHPHGDGAGVCCPLFQVTSLPSWKVALSTQSANHT